MKLRHTDVVLDWEGQPARQLVGGTTDEPKYEDITFRSLIISSLNNMRQGEQPNGSMLEKAYLISSRLYRSGDEIELTVDEAAFIKERASTHLLPLFYGRLCDWLEQKDQWLPGDPVESPASA